MFEREIVLSRFMHQITRLMVSDLTESEWHAVPDNGQAPPVWTVGHLAGAAALALRFLGRDVAVPEGVSELFGMGSAYEAGLAYPDPRELVAHLEAWHGELLAALESVDGEAAAGPNPLEPARFILPTLGDQLAHMATTHIAHHNGQLAAWRRSLGKPSGEELMRAATRA
jgi:hypothetical protein